MLLLLLLNPEVIIRLILHHNLHKGITLRAILHLLVCLIIVLKSYEIQTLVRKFHHHTYMQLELFFIMELVFLLVVLLAAHLLLKYLPYYNVFKILIIVAAAIISLSFAKEELATASPKNRITPDVLFGAYSSTLS